MFLCRLRCIGMNPKGGMITTSFRWRGSILNAPLIIMEHNYKYIYILKINGESSVDLLDSHLVLPRKWYSLFSVPHPAQIWQQHYHSYAE